MPLSEAKSLLRNQSERNETNGRAEAGSQRNAQAKTLRQGNSSDAAQPLAHSSGLQPPISQSSYFFEHDPAADRAALEQLAISLDEFSPVIGLEQTPRPDCILLDITGIATLFGDEAQLLRGIISHCERAGYLIQTGVAETLAHARGIAQANGSSEAGDRKDAQANANQQSNSSGLRLPTSRFLLPVRALRLTDETLHTLHQLGIGTVSDLQRIKRRDLRSRFGDEILKRLDQLTGAIDEPVIALQRPAEFLAEQFIEHPTNNRKTIEVIVQRLVHDICKRMKAAQQGALQWAFRLWCSEHVPLDFRVNLFHPTATVDHVMQLAAMQLEQVLNPHTRRRRSRPVRAAFEKRSGKNGGSETRNRRNAQTETQRQGNSSSTVRPPASSSGLRPPTSHSFFLHSIQVQEITVSVTSCVLLAERQRQLFDENPRLDKQALAQLINQLTCRLGPEQVLYPTLRNEALPEYAIRYRPLVDPRRRRKRKVSKKKDGSHVMARPLRLIHPPGGIEWEDGDWRPEERANESKATEQFLRPPASDRPIFSSFSYHGQPHKIISHVGPERIESGWWRGPSRQRDYWRVETETGQNFWIYRNLKNGRWFLHGEF